MPLERFYRMRASRGRRAKANDRFENSPYLFFPPKGVPSQKPIPSTFVSDSKSSKFGGRHSDGVVGIINGIRSNRQHTRKEQPLRGEELIFPGPCIQARTYHHALRHVAGPPEAHGPARAHRNEYFCDGCERSIVNKIDHSASREP